MGCDQSQIGSVCSDANLRGASGTAKKNVSGTEGNEPVAVKEPRGPGFVRKGVGAKGRLSLCAACWVDLDQRLRRNCSGRARPASLWQRGLAINKESLCVGNEE